MTLNKTLCLIYCIQCHTVYLSNEKQISWRTTEGQLSLMKAFASIKKDGFVIFFARGLLWFRFVFIGGTWIVFVVCCVTQRRTLLPILIGFLLYSIIFSDIRFFLVTPFTSCYYFKEIAFIFYMSLHIGDVFRHIIN